MDDKNLKSMEVDAIGEILSISLGSSATALSVLLETKVIISPPKVQVQETKDIDFDELGEQLGVEIANVEGLDGSNVMFLKKNDARRIIELLTKKTIAEEEFELDNINESAICEVMNQMMGASATALSEMIGRTVNISTPTIFHIEDAQEFRDRYFAEEDRVVKISFVMTLNDSIECEFVNLMKVERVKELVSNVASAIDVDVDMDSEASLPTGDSDSVTEEGNTTEESSSVQSESTEEPTLAQMMESMKEMMGMINQQPDGTVASTTASEPSPKKIPVSPVQNLAFLSSDGSGEVQGANLDRIMGVPLEISVEIGRTKKLVKDILEFNKGSLVVLDKLAGEQVDLLVNGQCIAQGDVVVVDENFGIRITEILADELPSGE